LYWSAAPDRHGAYNAAMQLKRIGPLSLARLAAALYAVIGLCIGAIFALAAVVGAGIGAAAGDSSPLLGLLFGVGAIVFLPLMYGVLGALAALLIAALYNALAARLGGVEVTLE
jgi:hypothetical protein